MLILTRKPGQRILIGNSIVISLLHSDGGGVRLGIEAPPEVLILREELQIDCATCKTAVPASTQATDLKASLQNDPMMDLLLATHYLLRTAKVRQTQEHCLLAR